LINLRILKLPTNHLSSLPDNIGTLGNTLKTLALTQNDIRTLPESMNTLKTLTTVRLSFNKIVSLVPLSDLPKLTNIEAMNCQIKFLPSNLTMLANLNLQSNNITDINYLHKLISTKLSILNLGNNQIDMIPPKIPEFAPTLTNLQLNNNLLFYFPSGILLLTSLTVANIANNKFDPNKLTTIKTNFLQKLPRYNLIVNISLSFNNQKNLVFYYKSLTFFQK
jgi:Leucine-rich repeat (LRR) protein